MLRPRPHAVGSRRVPAVIDGPVHARKELRMRSLLILVATGLLVGCASETASVSPQPAATYAATDTPEATTLAEAQKLGYKIVNEDGKTMYCRETPKLGSHVKKERTCLTEAE